MYPKKHHVVRLIVVFYKFVMPFITILSLMGISQITQRPKFLGSEFIDFVTRVLLSLWFCFSYVRLPHLRQHYRFYPNIEWSKSDIHPSARLVYIGIGSAFGVFITIITSWVIRAFIPILSDYSLVLAILNGLIYAIPMALQYEVFKL
jgi:hypothetical protein